MTCKLVYMLAISSPEEAANRKTKGERIKVSEYRRLGTWAGYFLHRTADPRRRGGIQYHTSHWREVRTVTLSAGRWQLRASVLVLGSVSRVQEDYITVEGARIATAVSWR